MIRIGDIHCSYCGDEFEPDGVPSSDPDVKEFCSEDCALLQAGEDADHQSYRDARESGAPYFAF